METILNYTIKILDFVLSVIDHRLKVMFSSDNFVLFLTKYNC